MGEASLLPAYHMREPEQGTMGLDIETSGIRF